MFRTPHISATGARVAEVKAQLDVRGEDLTDVAGGVDSDAADIKLHDNELGGTSR